MNANEKMADEFDCKLYRLVGLAQALGESGAVGPRPKWLEIARELSSVRPKVRGMMEASQRAKTVG